MIQILLHLLLKPVHAASQGKWEVIGTTPNVCIHTAVLPNDKFLCFERPHFNYDSTDQPFSPNPFSGGFLSSEIDLIGNGQQFGVWQPKSVLKNPLYNPFCAGHAQMANGSILVIGGDMQADIDSSKNFVTLNGIRRRRIYNPCPSGIECPNGGDWESLPEMSTGRWYPTVVTLKDGSFIIFSGSLKNIDFENLDNTNNPTYEYWPTKEGAWPKTLDILNWAFPHNLYPMSFLLPSGNVFLFVSNKTILIDPETDKISNKVPDLIAPNHEPLIYPHSPTMTMLPLTAKNGYKAILRVCGGSKKPASSTEKIQDKKSSNLCWHINPDDENPTWIRKSDMPRGRLMPDSVLLPDGKILYVNGEAFGVAGGNAGQIQYAKTPVFETDLYDPDTDSWQTLSSTTVARLYHSGAFLTSTGHVVTVGSEMKNYVDLNKANCYPNVKTQPSTGCTDPFEYRMERFTPPYLESNQPKPVIKSAPSKLTPNSTFFIELASSAIEVDKVSFIRYTTVTHNTNTDQRFVELDVIARSGNQLYLRAPSNTALAPPGNWYLFALRNGIPSVAKTVNFDNGNATFVNVPSSNNANHSKANTLLLGVVLVLMTIFIL